MSNIRRINPSGTRYLRNRREIVERVVSCTDAIDGRIAGFAVLVWDDRGATAGFQRSGGPISMDYLPEHVRTVLAGD